jgi:SAM-dependent methyltransferase
VVEQLQSDKFRIKCMQPLKIDYQLEYWDTEGLRKTYNHPINFEQLNQLLCRDSKILDYGCGYGRVSNDLYLHGYTNIIGIDFSTNIIDKGRSLYPH